MIIDRDSLGRSSLTVQVSTKFQSNHMISVYTESQSVVLDHSLCHQHSVGRGDTATDMRRRSRRYTLSHLGFLYIHWVVQLLLVASYLCVSEVALSGCSLLVVLTPRSELE
jgi:hypothetical protein